MRPPFWLSRLQLLRTSWSSFPSQSKSVTYENLGRSHGQELVRAFDAARARRGQLLATERVENISRTCSRGEPFLFKLHSPENYIVGGGFFVRYPHSRPPLAWERIRGEERVYDSLEHLISRVRRYRADDQSTDPVIGCNRPRRTVLLATQ